MDWLIIRDLLTMQYFMSEVISNRRTKSYMYGGQGAPSRFLQETPGKHRTTGKINRLCVTAAIIEIIKRVLWNVVFFAITLSSTIAVR